MSYLEGFVFDLQRHDVKAAWPAKSKVYALKTDAGADLTSVGNAVISTTEVSPGSYVAGAYYLVTSDAGVFTIHTATDESDLGDVVVSSSFASYSFDLTIDAETMASVDLNGLGVKVNITGLPGDLAVTNAADGSTATIVDLAASASAAAISLNGKTYTVTPTAEQKNLKFTLTDATTTKVENLAATNTIVNDGDITLTIGANTFVGGSTVIGLVSGGAAYKAIANGKEVTLTGQTLPSITLSADGTTTTEVTVSAASGDSTDDNTAKIEAANGKVSEITYMAAATKIVDGSDGVTYTSDNDDATKIVKVATVEGVDLPLQTKATLGSENGDVVGASYGGYLLFGGDVGKFAYLLDANSAIVDGTAESAVVLTDTKSYLVVEATKESDTTTYTVNTYKYSESAETKFAADGDTESKFTYAKAENNVLALGTVKATITGVVDKANIKGITADDTITTDTLSDSATFTLTPSTADSATTFTTTSDTTEVVFAGFDNGGKAGVGVTSTTATKGGLTLSVPGTVYGVAANHKLVDTVEYTQTSEEEDTATVAFSTGEVTVTGLNTNGEAVVIKNGEETLTYTVVDGTDKLKEVYKENASADAVTKYFKLSGITEVTHTKQTGAGLSGEIKTSTYAAAATEVTNYFNSSGVAFTTDKTADGDLAATLTVPESGAADTTKTLAITKTLTSGVDASGDTVAVTDTTSETKITVDTNLAVTGTGFTTTGGVLSSTDSLATVTVDKTTSATSMNVSGKLNVDISAATAALTGGVVYKSTTVIAEASTVTIGENKTVTVTEAENNADDTTIANTGAVTGLNKGGIVKFTGITDQTVDTVSLTAEDTVQVNGVTFTAAEASALKIVGAATPTLTNGAVTVTGSVTVTDGETLNASGAAKGVTLKAGTSATGSSGVDITGLSVNDSVTYGTQTFTAISSDSIMVRDSSDNSVKTYTLNDTGKTAGVTIGTVDLVGGLSESGNFDETEGMDWRLYSQTQGSATVKFDTNGTLVSDTTSPYAFTSSASVSGTTLNLNVAVTSKVAGGIMDLASKVGNYTIGTVTVKDSNTGTVYTLDGSKLSATESFTYSNTDKNITAAAGTLSVDSGAVSTRAGSASYVLGDNATSLTYEAGYGVNNSGITTQKGAAFLTESTNTTKTVVLQDGTITGLDTGAVIKGAGGDQSLSTADDGTFTINGRTYTVSGDGDGVTFLADTAGVKSFSGLKNGSSITLAGEFSGGAIEDTEVTGGAGTFTGIKSVDGVTLTKNSDGTGYAIVLDKAGEAVTSNGVTYKADSVSGTGVTVNSATGVVSGLTNGAKVTLTDGTNGTTTYEAQDGVLLVTNAAGTTVYKQADSDTPFSVTYDSSAGTSTPVTGTVSVDRAETASMNNDLAIGSGKVDNVASGMLVDKNGNATTDTSKAAVQLTLTNEGDTVKYEAKKNNAQTVAITGTAATGYDWDITTGTGADNIAVTGGTKDVTVNAGEGKNVVNIATTGEVSVRTGSGNDEITLGNVGSGTVEVTGGNNKLTHNGTGEVTLKGSSGNDTFKSENADDTIIFGDGSNTLQLSDNGVTNTVSDYEFGKDKINTATTKGALDIANINVGTDGTIGYGTGEGTAKIGNDGQSVYAATLADADGRNKRNVGWTGAEGGMINATSLTERVVLIGNSEGAHDTLMGGQAGDTLKAGTGASSLWGGAGNDVIISSSTDSNEIFFLAGDGKDTVQGFTAYTEATADTADVLDFYGQGATDIKMTSQGLKIYNGESSMLVSGTYNADTMFRWKGNTGDEVRVAKIGYQDTANTMAYEDAATDYIGGRGIDTINATSGEVNLWMDGSKGKSFGNIEVINAAGNTENVTIAGGEGKNTLVGGTGDASLWGGVGSADDVLVGNGQTDFFYNMGGGNDSIAGHTGDTVDLFDMQLSDFTGVDLDTANRRVILSTTAGHNVTISGGVDTFKVGGQTWTTSYASGSDWTLKE